MAPGRWLRFRSTVAAFLLAVLTLTGPRFRGRPNRRPTPSGVTSATTRPTRSTRRWIRSRRRTSTTWRSPGSWRSNRDRGHARAGGDSSRGPFKSVSLMMRRPGLPEHVARPGPPRSTPAPASSSGRTTRRRTTGWTGPPTWAGSTAASPNKKLMVRVLAQAAFTSTSTPRSCRRRRSRWVMRCLSRSSRYRPPRSW